MPLTFPFAEVGDVVELKGDACDYEELRPGASASVVADPGWAVRRAGRRASLP